MLLIYLNSLVSSFILLYSVVLYYIPFYVPQYILFFSFLFYSISTWILFCDNFYLKLFFSRFIQKLSGQILLARDGSKDETYTIFVYEDYADASSAMCMPEVGYLIVTGINNYVLHYTVAW